MKILLIGSGGREHAIAWSLSKSPQVEHMLVYPGNPGIGRFAECSDETDIETLAKRYKPDLVVVGPELPLVDGLTDRLTAQGHKVFGPSASAARLEGSKSFAKALMQRAGIPTASSQEFTDPTEALAAIGDGKVVIKVDGLAAGKGVAVSDNRQEATEAIEDAMIAKRFGIAGERVIIEERLSGPELSILAFCDGSSFTVMQPAQDFKRAFDGDLGPNTGGMGAYSPVPVATDALMDEATGRIFEPLLATLVAEGIKYVGVFYAGLMITADGLKVIEFNCRFGDPEAQAVLPRLDSDLAEVMMACVDGQLNTAKLRWRDEACVSVVLAQQGYPGSHLSGAAINGFAHAESLTQIPVFHAGTAEVNRELVTSGGRVAAVSALGHNLQTARDTAYEAVGRVSFSGMTFRTDIAQAASEQET
ncbi:MAG: phosphoribosylamine--glycine ligase [Actinomycetota bacterium]